MTRPHLGAAGLLLLLCPSLGAAQVVTRAEALAAVSAFEGNSPANLASSGGPDARANAAEAARTLTRFCLESALVVVDLGAASVPWCERRKGVPEVSGEGERGVLLAAYLCGCVKAQLAANSADPNPYPGWTKMLDAYRALRVQGAERLPEVESLLAMEDRGMLRAHAAEALASSMAGLRRAYGTAGAPAQVASSR